MRQHLGLASVLFGAKAVKQMEENLGALRVLPLIDARLLERLRGIAAA